MARNPTPEERDERFTIPLDPETALRGLLAVNPDDEGQDQGDDEESTDES